MQTLMRNVARIDLHFVTQNVDPAFKWLLTPIKPVKTKWNCPKIFITLLKKKKKRKRERGERHDVFRSLNLSTSFYRMRVNKKYEFNIRNWAQISELSLCGTCTSKKVFFTRNLQNNIYVPRCRVSTNFG